MTNKIIVTPNEKKVPIRLDTALLHLKTRVIHLRGLLNFTLMNQSTNAKLTVY